MPHIGTPARAVYNYLGRREYKASNTAAKLTMKLENFARRTMAARVVYECARGNFALSNVI